jgi:uncharacterized membrane protein YqjE
MGFTLYAVFVAIGTGTPLGDMGLMMVFVFLTWAFEAPEALRAIALFSITCLLFGIIGTIVSIIKTRNSSQGQTRF